MRSAVLFLLFLLTNFSFASDVKFITQTSAIIANQISGKIVLEHPFESFSPVHKLKIPIVTEDISFCSNTGFCVKPIIETGYYQNLGFFSKKEMSFKNRFVFWGGVLFKRSQKAFLFGINISTKK